MASSFHKDIIGLLLFIGFFSTSLALYNAHKYREAVDIVKYERMLRKDIFSTAMLHAFSVNYASILDENPMEATFDLNAAFKSCLPEKYDKDRDSSSFYNCWKSHPLHTKHEEYENLEPFKQALLKHEESSKK